jgi:hypothetical protein
MCRSPDHDLDTNESKRGRTTLVPGAEVSHRTKGLSIAGTRTTRTLPAPIGLHSHFAGQPLGNPNPHTSRTPAPKLVHLHFALDNFFGIMVPGGESPPQDPKVGGFFLLSLVGRCLLRFSLGLANNSCKSNRRVNIANWPSGFYGHISLGVSQYNSTPLSSGSRR